MVYMTCCHLVTIRHRMTQCRLELINGTNSVFEKTQCCSAHARALLGAFCDAACICDALLCLAAGVVMTSTEHLPLIRMECQLMSLCRVHVQML